MGFHGNIQGILKKMRSEQFDPDGFIPETHNIFPLQWMGGMNQPVYGDIIGERTKNAIWLKKTL